MYTEISESEDPRSEPELTWADCHWIGPDAAAGVRELKAQPGGELLVPGSANLIQTLLNDDLVDGVHLITYPVVLGKGKGSSRRA